MEIYFNMQLCVKDVKRPENNYQLERSILSEIFTFVGIQKLKGADYKIKVYK